jgi:hypothetical protein
VYVAGDNGNNPVLWTDNSAQVLSPSKGSADQVVTSGSDVYVAGFCGESGLGLPSGPGGIYAYWKNGLQVNVGDTEILHSIASIAVVDGNLYFANGSLWVNGSPTSLPEQGVYGQIREVFASGNDIYAVGSDNNNAMVYWKDGLLNGISVANAGSGFPTAFCIYITGDDIYVGGDDAEGRPAYWKNGVVNELQPAVAGSYVSQARSIFVSGNDVYVVGNFYSTSYLQPAYWKNGVQQNLSLNGAVYGMANAIFVADSTVYVVGQTSAGAVLWKNGVATVLAPNGSANSIIVQ